MELSSNKFNRKIMHYYFLLGAIEGIGALIVLMLIPPDPKNTWLWGFSRNRLILAGGMFVLSGLLAGISIKTWRNDKFSIILSEKMGSSLYAFGWIIPVILGGFILVFYTPYLYILRSPGVYPVIERIMPIIIWGFLLSLQTLALVLMFKRRRDSEATLKEKEFISLEIKPYKITIILSIVFVLMFITSISFHLLDHSVNDSYLNHFIGKMDFDSEQTVPTYFSSTLLLFAAVLFGLIGMLKKNEKAPYTTQWIFLAGIFLFLSIDEVIGIHEMLSKPMMRRFKPTGIFSDEWVVLYIPLLLIFVAAYARYFFDLPKKYKLLFAAAGGIYVSGALGFELIGAGYTDKLGWDIVYKLLALIEESLEMIGIILLIFALMTYIVEYYGQIIQLKLHENIDNPK